MVKCYRKAALCYIEKREYAQASAVIRRCPQNEAATLYVIFLIAIQQGLFQYPSYRRSEMTLMFTVLGSEVEGGPFFQHINLYEPSCFLAAISAIQDVVNAPDFDRRMLILATQISHKSDKRHVLLVVLECLLRSLKVGSGSEAVPETMTLIRCIIKLILGVLVQPATKRYVQLYSVLSCHALITAAKEPIDRQYHLSLPHW